MTTDRTADPEPSGIGLADAIEMLRRDLLAARASGGGSDIQLPVESMTVELDVVATRSAGGKAGFRVPLVNVELGGSAGVSREATQRVTIQFGPPVDRTGKVVKVAQVTNEELG